MRGELSKHSQSGFSLLELLVVVSILGLLATVASTRIGGNYSRVKVDTAITEIANLDQRARSLACRQREAVVLRIDLTAQRLWAEMDGEETSLPIVLPTGVTIDRMLSVREQKSSGTATIRIAKRGGAETYAIRIVGANKSARWLVFAGGSGQPLEMKTNREVEDLFHAIKKTSFHAT